MNICQNISSPPSQFICVLLICGIPAAGKSFLGKILEEKFKEKFSDVIYLNFDDLFLNANTDDVDLSKFKQTRDQFYKLFNKKFTQICHNITTIKSDTLFILDDNFYFKSMRKPFYKLCKETLRSWNKNNNYRISYSELHIRCTLDYALMLNSQRESCRKIPEEIICKINEQFQWDSFNDNFILDVTIIDENTLIEFLKERTEILYNHLIKCSETLYELVIKEESELQKVSSVVQKENKAIFLDLIELGLRKTINELMQDEEMKRTLDGKEISKLKKEYVEYSKAKLASSSDIQQQFSCKGELDEIFKKIEDSGYDTTIINQIQSEFANHAKILIKK